jgi:hypothetical protein
VGEHGRIALEALELADHPIHAPAHVGGRLAVRAAVAPQVPVRTLLPDLRGRDPLVLPVVPLDQVVGQLGALAHAGQPAGLDGSVERAREHALERKAGEGIAQQLGLAPPLVRQRDVGAARVAQVTAPLRLAVASQQDLHMDDRIPNGDRFAMAALGE